MLSIQKMTAMTAVTSSCVERRKRVRIWTCSAPSRSVAEHYSRPAVNFTFGSFFSFSFKSSKLQFLCRFRFCLPVGFAGEFQLRYIG